MRRAALAAPPVPGAIRVPGLYGEVPGLYEEVYLHAYETGREARAGTGIWIRFYHTERPYCGLTGALRKKCTGLPFHWLLVTVPLAA